MKAMVLKGPDTPFELTQVPGLSPARGRPSLVTLPSKTSERRPDRQDGSEHHALRSYPVRRSPRGPRGRHYAQEERRHQHPGLRAGQRKTSR